MQGAAFIDSVLLQLGRELKEMAGLPKRMTYGSAIKTACRSSVLRKSMSTRPAVRADLPERTEAVKEGPAYLLRPKVGIAAGIVQNMGCTVREIRTATKEVLCYLPDNS